MDQPRVGTNLLEPVAKALEHEIVEQILRSDRVRIERIVSRGQASPDGFWYDLEENEWVAVLTGRAGLRFQGREEIVVLNPGDHIEIPAHTRHRVEWTSAEQDTVWLAVFYRAGPLNPNRSRARVGTAGPVEGEPRC